MGDVKSESLSGDEVVISGISGIFPSSENIKQFKDNLFNKVDMVESSENYWNFNNSEVPKYVGKLKGLEYFDSSFFKVPSTQGVALDAMSRKLLEEAFSALFDAGVNPRTLSGQKIGVFVGSSFTDINVINMFDQNKYSKYMVSGGSKSMLANRISYWLDVKGPSYGLDGSCSSSTTCLTIAYRSIKSGHCDAAIVAGCNHCQHPVLSANMNRAGYLCADGKTKCFDKKGDGYVRSEAISVLFLQKLKNAKRIYTEIYYADEKYFAKPDALFLPSRNPNDVEKFLRKFYLKAGVSPNDVEYVEANGAGLADADAEELEAIDRVFAKDDTVFVGCVKSNMGHSECASGVCGVTKVCLAYHQGRIPGNLHYNEPLNQVPGVKEGRIQVVSENIPFSRSFTALNTFSYTGLNYHVLMKGHYKAKADVSDATAFYQADITLDASKYLTSIPRLILASGRTESCVQRITDLLKSAPVDPEQIALLHDVFKTDISGHQTRGYVLLDSNKKNETVCLSEDVTYLPDTKYPVWFLYSGMGSQWAGMGRDLMRMSIFAAAVQKCHKILEPKGMNILKIITDLDENNLDLLSTFVAITSIQIGLTDTLKELGIKPDNIIGHSFGELGCAYADGSLSLEQTMLASYYRGLVSVESKFERGSMAAVKLGHKEVQLICPPEIETACHNSSDSTTISGPEDIMKAFVKDLKGRGIFAKEVQCYNIAFHSKYIKHAEPKLLTEMKKVITTPKVRSKQWICSSVHPDNWRSDEAKFASAEYFSNNLLNKVYFEEASKMIPDNAIVIEIAPHGLLQAIVRRSLKNCIHVPLTKRGCVSPIKFFFEAIGKLYQAGLNPHVDVLYPKVEYPVSTETPLLSHFVAWEHSSEWDIALFKKRDATLMAAREIMLSVQEDEWKYVEGHVRNGMNIFPESTLLCLVWETLTMYKGFNYKEMPIIFNDVKFHEEIVIRRSEDIKLIITIQKGNNRFEVTRADTLVASGIVINKKHFHSISELKPDFEDENTMDKKKVYNTLSKNGYNYNDDYQLIQKLNLKNNIAKLGRTDEFPTFLDSFIQLHALIGKHNAARPKFIRFLRINIAEYQANKHDETYIKIDNDIYVSTKGAGVDMQEVIFDNILITNNMETVAVNLNGDTKDATMDASKHIMTPEDAVSVPLPYLYAYYCLVIRGKLNDERGIFISDGVRSKNVLIINGADAFGRAAIAVCLASTCTVYTTVSCDDEKQLLMTLFPQLKDSNVITSTDEHFIVHLVNNTENELCDIVLNRACGLKREYAMKCVGHSGYFLDISKHDMKENVDFGMAYLQKAKSYISVQLSNLFTENNLNENKILNEIIRGDIEKGIIKPFSSYGANESKTDINTNDITPNRKENDTSQDDRIQFSVPTTLHKKQTGICEVDGLEAFYAHIDKDECVATSPLVLMSTPLSKALSQVEGEINPEDTFLVMIPGFSGNHQVFKSVCKRLKIQAITMQIGPDKLEDSIADIAQNMLSEIKRTFKLKSKFYILGYSFGVNVALELAALIEKEGYTGVIYCLDSSPDVLKTQINAYLGVKPNIALQNDIIAYMYKLMSKRNADEIMNEIKAIENWSEKIEYFVRELKNFVTLSHEYIRQILESSYKRVLLAKNYTLDIKLESEIVLIKGIAHSKSGKLPDDYNLSEYTVNAVQVFDIESDHVSAPEDIRVSNIINKMLDPELIQYFKGKNLCERYNYY